MEYRWDYPPAGSPARQQALTESLGISATLAQILEQRGVHSFAQAKQFFRPQWSQLHDPLTMKDMDRAVERVHRAVQQQERIMIYGDYDVDGTTAVALLYSFLKPQHPHLLTYIPDRYAEGYGVSQAGVEEAFRQKVKLIIALDCGIKARRQVAYAREKGIDFIICDHHLPGAELPAAVAVLDPKRPDCPYPFKELSGCGVGFKLAQALAQKWHLPKSAYQDLADLLAVSIGADIVPIVGENRVLAAFGLRKLNEDPRPGLKLLQERSQAKASPWDITKVVFQIGPRINAAGRIAHGREAVALLTATNGEAVSELAGLIDEHNQNRKELDQNITREALRQIEAAQEQERATTVVQSAHWHKGVIGIVASRLTEHYYRPTVVLAENDGLLTGSARSVQGFNLYEALEECEPHLEQFGGHAFAAGMSMRKEQYESFKAAFEAAVAKRLRPEHRSPSLSIDAELAWPEINGKFYRVMQQMAPFGPGNPQPLFVSHGLLDSGESRAVGNDQRHLKLHLRCPSSGLSLGGIAFNLAERWPLVRSGRPISVVYHLEINEFKDQKSWQMRVLDIKLTV